LDNYLRPKNLLLEKLDPIVKRLVQQYASRFLYD